MRRKLIPSVARLPRLAGLSLLACMALMPAENAAHAAPPKGNNGAKTACLAAHEEALSLRSQKKPHAALEKFVACARVECPTVVRKECVEQVALVEKDAPTVALEARDEAGMDTTAVKVTMDGATLTERLTGSAVDVEPGEHVFHFERADGKSIDQRVLVVEGDKNRKVVADFGTLVPKPPPVVSVVAPPLVPHERKKVPALAFVAGGLALVGVGSFAFFAVSGKGKEKDLQGSCQPSCTGADVRPVKTSYLIADISLAVGVVAAAAAIILALPALGDSGQASARIARQREPAPWMPRIRMRDP